MQRRRNDRPCKVGYSQPEDLISVGGTAHLLIGIAMILGIGMRLSALGGGLLMFLYYIPRFSFPDVIVEYHLVYTVIIVYLALIRAGQIYGIENWVKQNSPASGLLQRNRVLNELIS